MMFYCKHNSRCGVATVVRLATRSLGSLGIWEVRSGEGVRGCITYGHTNPGRRCLRFGLVRLYVMLP